MAVRVVGRRLVVTLALAGALVTAGTAGAAGVEPNPPPGAPPAPFTNTSLANPHYRGADTEPSLKFAPDGTAYVGAIRGLPSGIDLWRVEPGGMSSHLSSPDSLLPATDPCCVALGGGDMDLAIGGDGTIAFSSLGTPVGGPSGVVVAWFGASTADPDARANAWRVYAAESRNATAAAPTYRLFQVSDHVIHRGMLCESGLNCSSGRELGDFFQVAVAPDGIAGLAWADDGAGGAATVSYARGGLNLGSPE